MVDASKGYPSRGVVDGKMEPWPAPYILMVDRGGCTFVKKVGNLTHFLGYRFRPFLTKFSRSETHNVLELPR